MRRLVTGIVGAPYGLKGYMHVRSLSGETDHFFNLTEIALKKKSLERVFAIEDVAGSAGSLRLKLAGIDSPEEAKKYSSWEIVVPRDKACPLNKDEWYVGDLCQCKLTYQGAGVGDVVDVIEGGGGSLLNAALLDGRGVFVPLNDVFIGEVDIARKTIELRNSWILDE